VNEMSHTIAKQFGSKSQEMASVLECENENPASDEERHAAIERLRLLCNLVSYNSVKIWPSKDPLSNVENDGAL